MHGPVCFQLAIRACSVYEQYALRSSRSMQCSTTIMVSSDILTLPAVHVGLDRMDLRIAATNH